MFKLKKLKDRYPKLTLYKVWVLHCKNNERSGVISEVLHKNFLG
jgi:hypothetical protein